MNSDCNRKIFIENHPNSEVFILSIPIYLSIIFSDIVAKLRSPSNTTVSILEGNRFDISWDGFENQSILSLATWGENPTGEWRLDMFHRSENRDSNSRPFTLSGARLEIYGTSNQPAKAKKDSLHAAYGKLICL